MPMSLRALVVLALVATLGAVPAGAAAAAGTRSTSERAAVQRARGDAPAGQTKTVVQSSRSHDDRSMAVTVLLVGAGATAGVIIGAIPALVAAMLLGYVPPPRLRVRLRLRSAGPPDELTAFARLDAADARRAAALLPAPAPSPATTILDPDPAGHAPPVEPEATRVAILAHARHQAIYDAAYAEQLTRVEALRTAIDGRLRDAPPDRPTD
jgi:hypothetical protein